MSGTNYNAENPFEDEGNPFESTAKQTSYNQSAYTQPTIASPQTQPIPNTSSSWDSNLTEESISRKETELRRREEDLERREQVIATREQTVGRGRVKNWPRCRPILYHSIDGEIPQEQRGLVKRAYYGWFGIVFALTWNLLVVAAVLAVGGSIPGFFLGLAFWLVSIPMSFFTYKRLYEAARKGKSSTYILYFIMLWMSFLVYGWLAAGVDGWGGGGIVICIDQIGSHLVVGIFALVDVVLMGLVILYHLYIFVAARREYKKAAVSSS